MGSTDDYQIISPHSIEAVIPTPGSLENHEKELTVKKDLLYFVAVLVVASWTGLRAQTSIEGKIIDENNQPITNVTVMSTNFGTTTQTDLDGKFSATPIASGSISLTFSHVGFIPKTIKLASGIKNVEITLIAQKHPMDGITVTAGRALEGRSPVAFTNMDRETIDRNHDIGEVPALLETTPNLYSWSDAGGGLGYSYLSIRGFDARRVPVYINGVPQNDPEDHALYFVDLPDFAADADNIQVQRGVGNSLYGDPAFGGSINILTSPISDSRQFISELGYGGFLHDGETVGIMRKSSVSYSTGLTNGGWALSGRWIRQFSGGYRQNSWYDGTAYYLSIGRVDPKMITTVNIYGGPMKTHTAWDGIDRATAYFDRRINWYSYDNETDNFNQPHFELHNIYNLSKATTFYNTLYYIRGKGYYEQLRFGESLQAYNLSDDPTLTSDLVRRKWVNKYQLGFNSQAVHNGNSHTSSLGGSYYFFESDHWGEAIWAEELSLSLLNIDDPMPYYEYFGKYHNFSVYGFHSQQIGEKLTLTGNLQLRYLHKDIHQTPIGVYGTQIYDLNWLFLSPRIGINYAANENLTPYFSFSIASHEPNDDMIDDADDPDDVPRLALVDTTTVPIVFGDPLVDAERVYDFELGANYRSSNLSLDANLFWMEYRNEIVPDGGLNDDGFPTIGNADRSVHRGLELGWNYSPFPELKIRGNYSFNDNWIKEYDQFVENVTVDTVMHRNVAVPNSPSWLANLAIDYTAGSMRLIYRIRGVGRQYVSIDGRHAFLNDVFEDVSIAPYAISSIKGVFNLGSFLGDGDLTLEGRVDNLFNQRYETYGYRWGDYFAYWPAAERNWFVNLKLAIK
jgi:iron complex outermembrane receptor protein